MSNKVRRLLFPDGEGGEGGAGGSADAGENTTPTETKPAEGGEGAGEGEGSSSESKSGEGGASGDGEKPIVADAFADNAEGESEGNASKEGEGEGETFKFTLPEGAELDKEAGDSFLKILEEGKVGDEVGQKLVDLYAGTMQATMEKIEAARVEMEHEAERELKKTREEWIARTKADPELGGANFKDSGLLAQKGLAGTGTPELAELFNQTGLAYHPEVRRHFARVGKMLSNDSSPPSGGGDTKEVSVAEQFFGGTMKE
jgi:hypothetical protein